MDVQVSNGREMLLKYVTSYVTKMHDSDILSSIKVTVPAHFI